MTTAVYHKSVTDPLRFNELRLRILCHVYWAGTEDGFNLPRDFFNILYASLNKLTSDPTHWEGINKNNVPREPTIREELSRIRYLLNSSVVYTDAHEVVGEPPPYWPCPRDYTFTLFEGAAVLIWDALSHTAIEKKTKQVHTEFII